MLRSQACKNKHTNKLKKVTKAIGMFFHFHVIIALNRITFCFQPQKK